MSHTREITGQKEGGQEGKTNSESNTHSKRMTKLEESG